MALMEKKKKCRKENFMKKIVGGDRPTQAASFLKRNPTLKKKAQELKTLCGINVVLVSYHPDDGSCETWPEIGEKSVREAVVSYKQLDQKLKVESNLFKFLEAKKAKLVKGKKRAVTKKLGAIFESLSKHVDGLSGQELMDFVNFAENKLKGFREKITCLELEKATHQAKSVVPLASVPCNFNSFMDFNAAQNNIQQPTDNAEWNYNYSTTIAFGSNPKTNTNILTTGNFNDVDSNLMDEIWKQVSIIENQPGKNFNNVDSYLMDEIWKQVSINENQPGKNFNNVDSYLMDEIWKQVLINENQPGNQNPGNFSNVDSNLMDDIWKQVLINENHPGNQNPGNFNNVDSNLMDDIWNQVLINENQRGMGIPENLRVGNGFLYGSGSNTIAGTGTGYGSKIAMAGEFYSNNTEDFAMAEDINDLNFWWDGELFQI